MANHIVGYAECIIKKATLNILEYSLLYNSIQSSVFIRIIEPMEYDNNIIVIKSQGPKPPIICSSVKQSEYS